MLLLTLFYITYLGQMDFFDVPATKFIELMNESFFVLLQYNLLILTGLIEDEDLNLIAGYLIIGIGGFLLAINLVIILYVSIRAICRKCYLRNKRSNVLKKHEKSESRRKLILANKQYWLDQIKKREEEEKAKNLFDREVEGLGD